jgi:hypothetical protein
VEFAGLEAGLRDALKGLLMNLALTKLRAGRPGQQVPSGPPAVAVPRPAPSRKAAFDAAAAARPGAPAPAETAASAQASAPAAGGGEPLVLQTGGEQAPAGRRRKMYLGEILVKQGAVAAEELQQFLARAPGDKVPIGQKLLSHGLVDDVTIAKALAVQSGLPYIDLINEKPDHQLVHSLPREPFIKHHCVPLKMEWQALVVVMAERPSPPVMEELELAAGRRVRAAIGAESGLTRLLLRLYNYEAPARFAKARFPVQLRVEYRFFDKDRGAPVHDLTAAGLTRELGVREMIIAGPLPAGVDAERVRKESLTMEVQVEGGRLPNAMILQCRPLSISSSGYAGEYHIACYIDGFPPGGENAWTRLCMQVG